MKDPDKRRNFTILDVIMIVFIIAFAFFIYKAIGGEWSIFTRLKNLSGSSNPLANIGGTLDAFGQGIGDMFKNMLR